VKIKQFHTLVSQNKKLLTISCATGIDQAVTKRMMHLYEARVRGEPVSHCPKRTQVTKAFRLLLDGLTDDEMLEKGLMASDIAAAKRFHEMIPDIEKMLLATLAEKFDISRITVSRMLKIYREKQADRMQAEEIIENRTSIPITA
jgi:predicted DNA-binding protein (UPF0251 family)